MPTECSKPCKAGLCSYADCIDNVASCPGGKCLFERCVSPKCGGGSCAFKACVNPNCGGGKCTFTDCTYGANASERNMHRPVISDCDSRCVEGQCLFVDCNQPAECAGGKCRFTHAFRPKCAGGGCLFEQCVEPSCSGGACHEMHSISCHGEGAVSIFGHTCRELESGLNDPGQPKTAEAKTQVKASTEEKGLASPVGACEIFIDGACAWYPEMSGGGWLSDAAHGGPAGSMSSAGCAARAVSWMAS